ncbi:MAG: tetratricopeptide repeat protein [Spirochaetaceae bacterium]|jgi:Ca-activated chloride channel family protein|nr:tetratricopeptide repeat protein [Spirochaetaceae bacterium]
MLKRFVLVITAVALFVSCAPVRSRLKLVQGNVYFSRGKYAEAAGFYIEAMDDPKTAPYAAYSLGAAYFVMEQDEAALARFGEAEKNASVEENRELIYRSRYNSGIIRFTNGDFEGAAADFKRALEVDGSRVDAKLNFELSMLSLTRKGESAQVRTTQEGSVSANETRRKSEILFNFVRQKESKRWKSWDFAGETDTDGPDY